MNTLSDHYKAYQDYFKVDTSDTSQFKTLHKLGISASDIYDRIVYSSNNSIRDSYNINILEIYETYYKYIAHNIHCNQEDINPGLAMEATSVRNELKEIHHQATPFYGKIAIYAYKLYKYGTWNNPDYDS